MVHNPIYNGDGPVYESVQTQLEILNNEIQLRAEDTRDRQYDNIRLSLNNTAWYIDLLWHDHMQYLYKNTASKASDSVNAPTNI